MSDDITKELPMSTNEKIDQLFIMMRNVISGMNNLDMRMTTIEQELASLKAGTNPFWQAMQDQQRQILENLQAHSARMDRLEEKVDTGFRKLGDKFDHLVQDYYDLHADVRDLNRRVTRLEPVN